MPADLVAISPLTEQTFEWPRTSSFRAYGHIRQPDPRLRPAMNGNMDVIVSRIPERHQHSGQGRVHAQWQAHRVCRRKGRLSRGRSRAAGAQSG